jgi:hypothetical protein
MRSDLRRCKSPLEAVERWHRKSLAKRVLGGIVLAFLELVW